MRYAPPAVSLQLRAICVGSYALQDVMHVFVAQLAFSLCGPLAVRRPLATWSPLAITLGCPVALAVLRLGQSFLTFTVLRHCVQYVLS